MSNGAPAETITRAALNRLEANAKERENAIRILMDERDRRYEQRFTDSGTAVQAALMAAEKAVTKAETASEKRFEGVNEFRNTLADQQRTLMPRPEAELRMGSIETSLVAIQKQLAETGGQRAGGKEMWGYIVGGIGVLLAVASRFIR